ncbi:hypothetical protein JCM8547_004582 [Rhodosporidiobolus lusitaniae]
MTTPANVLCRSCSAHPERASTCNGTLPCSACTSSSSNCTKSPPPPLPSAWTSADLDAVQRWPEPTKATVGGAGAGWLQPRRNERGEIVELEWAEMTQQRYDLRIRPKKQEGALLFPSTVDDHDEPELYDLEANPATFLTDRKLLENIHNLAPNDPLHVPLLFNTTLRAAPTTAYKRVRSQFQPFDLNRGNILSAANISLASPSSSPSSADASNSTCVAWRRASRPNGRATSVGWGAFAPLPANQRPRVASWKGKERVLDEDDSPRLPSGAFIPSSTPILNDITPIQQLQLSPLNKPSSAFLVVRSLTSFSLLRLDLSSSFDPGKGNPPIVDEYSYSWRDIGSRTLADFALGGSSGGGRLGAGLAVDVEGSLYGWGLAGGGGDAWAEGRKPEFFRLRKGKERKVEDYSGFARVEYGGMGGMGAVVALEDEVMLYDLRSSSSSLTLVDSRILTSLLPFDSTSPTLIVSLLSRSPISPSPSSPYSPPTSIYTVCTTRDVLWLDERMPGREVLRWGHNRVGLEAKGPDRTLSLIEIPPYTSSLSLDPTKRDEDTLQRFAMSSRIRAEVQVYTTELNPTSAPTVALDPYYLPPPSFRPSMSTPSAESRSGIAFVPLPPLPSTLPPPSEPAPSDRMDVDLSSPDSDGLPSRRRTKRRSLSDSPRLAMPVEAWRMLEVNALGEVRGREVSVGGPFLHGAQQWAERGEEAAVQEEDMGAESRVWDEGIEELAKARPKLYRRLPEVKGKERAEVGRERLAEILRVKWMLRQAEEAEGVREGEAMQQDETGEKEDDENGKEATERALKMLKMAVEMDQEKDVGMLTALELLSFSTDRPERVIPSEEDVNTPELTSLPHRHVLLAHLPGKAAIDVSSDNVERLVQAAPSSLPPPPADPPTSFSTLFLCPHIPPLPRSDDENEPAPASRLGALARTRVRHYHDLASRIVLPRPIVPDEGHMYPNQSFPSDLEPPPLHFGFFRPTLRARTETDGTATEEEEEEEPSTQRERRRRRRKKRPPPDLDSWGARFLLAEWHVGSDRRSYEWINPYQAEEDEQNNPTQDQPVDTKAARRRSKKEKEKELSQTRFGSSQGSSYAGPSQPPGQPPMVAPASVGPSSSQPFQPSALRFSSQPQSQPQSHSQSQDWSQHAASQPAIMVTAPYNNSDSLPSSQSFGFGGAASQTVPGAFGSRLQALKERKKAGLAAGGKKRKAGF